MDIVSFFIALADDTVCIFSTAHWCNCFLETGRFDVVAFDVALFNSAESHLSRIAFLSRVGDIGAVACLFHCLFNCIPVCLRKWAKSVFRPSVAPKECKCAAFLRDSNERKHPEKFVCDTCWNFSNKALRTCTKLMKNRIRKISYQIFDPFALLSQTDELTRREIIIARL